MFINMQKVFPLGSGGCWKWIFC